MLGDVEDEINEVLLRDLEVRWFVTDQAEAKRIGAIAMFGEKYGDQVRVVEIGDYSRELCGGTHVPRSSVIGMVKLLGESSIGSGVRRVEALVGLDAFRYLAREHVLVQQLSGEFKAQPDELPERIGARARTAQGRRTRTGQAARGRRSWPAPGTLAAAAEQVGAGAARRWPQPRPASPATTCGPWRSTCAAGCPTSDPAVVLLASPAAGGRRRLRGRVNEAGQAAGLAAGDVVRMFAPGARGARRRQARPGPGRRRRRGPSWTTRSPRPVRAWVSGA